MIDLKINNLYVDPGTYGWTLCQKRTTKNKKNGETKETFTNLSYHGDLLAAVREAWRVTQRDRLSEKNCELKYAVEVMEEIKREFIAQLREIDRAENGGDGDD